MKRSKIEEGKIHWKKIGGGSLRLGAKIIKPGQTFYAFPHEISETFRDVVVPVDGKTVEDNIAVEGTPAVFSLKHRGGPWYNIVDADGKVMNEKALSRDNALKLIEELSAE